MEPIEPSPAINPDDLDNTHLQAYLYCRQLAGLPAVVSPNSFLATAQRLFRDGRVHDAIDDFLLHLEVHGISRLLNERHEIDRQRFRFYREWRQMTLVQLATSIGVTQSSISHVELRRGGLTLVKSLLAAEALGVSPAEFIRVKGEQSPERVGEINATVDRRVEESRATEAFNQAEQRWKNL